jgi:membrane-associated phospholipid phosphatase
MMVKWLKLSGGASRLCGTAALFFLAILATGAAAPGGPEAYPVPLALAGIGLALAGVAGSGVGFRDTAKARIRVSPTTLLVVAALMLTLFGCLWWGVQHSLLNGPDEFAVHRFYRSGGRDVTTVMKRISGIGGRDLLVYVIPALLTAMLLLGRKSKALFLGSTMFGTFGLEVFFKTLAHRPRPDLVRGVHFDSFPSGHTLAAAILGGVLYMLLSPACRNSAHRVALGIAAFSWPVLMGMSRVYLGRHFVTDVVGGILLGVAWVCCCYALRSKLAECAGQALPSLMQRREEAR